MTTSTSETLKTRIRALARDQGFDACGFADPRAPWDAGARLAAFLQAGRHGEMAWMADTAERRSHPAALWPDARSAIVLGLNYGPDVDPMQALKAADRGAISVYAQGDDYHDVVKSRLKALARGVVDMHRDQSPPCEVKVFVDTAPLMEKPLAQAAGLGWQGRHTNLVSRRLGSWLFLGAVLTTLDIAPDDPETDHCGSCRACLDVCPTDAFPAPYQLDARRCLSYLTIEFAGAWPEPFRAAMGNRVYGCDDCLAVCPWNKFAEAASEAKFQARQALRAPALSDLAALDDAGFRALFAKSPIKRIGRDRFVRNVLYALGNSDRPDLAPHAAARLADPNPVVADAAAWALSRLSGPGQEARS